MDTERNSCIILIIFIFSFSQFFTDVSSQFGNLVGASVANIPISMGEVGAGNFTSCESFAKHLILQAYS